MTGRPVLPTRNNDAPLIRRQRRQAGMLIIIVRSVRWWPVPWQNKTVRYFKLRVAVGFRPPSAGGSLAIKEEAPRHYLARIRYVGRLGS